MADNKRPNDPGQIGVGGCRLWKHKVGRWSEVGEGWHSGFALGASF